VLIIADPRIVGSLDPFGHDRPAAIRGRRIGGCDGRRSHAAPAAC
jgi:hypothetical protein